MTMAQGERHMKKQKNHCNKTILLKTTVLDERDWLPLK